jgi:hypothetical protein
MEVEAKATETHKKGLSIAIGEAKNFIQSEKEYQSKMLQHLCVGDVKIVVNNE